MTDLCTTLKANVATTVIRAIAFILFFVGLPYWFKFDSDASLTLQVSISTLVGVLLLIGSYWLQHTSQHLRSVAIFFISIQAVGHLLLGIFFERLNAAYPRDDENMLRNGSIGTCVSFAASVCALRQTTATMLCYAGLCCVAHCGSLASIDDIDSVVFL